MPALLACHGDLIISNLSKCLALCLGYRSIRSFQPFFVVIVMLFNFF